jgi:hypothetical protein
MHRTILFFFWLWLSVQILHAQDSAWRAWLYHPSTGEMNLLDGQGFIRAQARLELPTGYFFYPYEVAVSGSGQQVAYMLQDSAGANARLRVQRITPGQRGIALDYELPPLFADGMSFISDDSGLFNPPETLLALGYSLKNGGWQIPLINLESGLAAQILRSGAGIAAELPSETGITPVVRVFDGRQVIFTLVQAAAIGTPGAERGCYQWDTQANSLISVESCLVLDSDRLLTTGEIVMARQNSDDSGSQLWVYDPLTQRAAAWFDAPGERLFMPRFVQNGEAILAGAYAADGKPIFRLLGRNGAVYATWDEGAALFISSLRGTAAGFAYTVDTINADTTGSTTLAHVNSFAEFDAGEALFAVTDNTRPRIVWLNDPQLQPVPYMPWVFLQDTPLEAPVVSPTLPAYARTDEWQVWLYQDDGLAVRLDQTGALLDTEILPFAATDSQPPTTITASADGTLLAYVVRDPAAARLQVVDTRRDMRLLDYALPAASANLIMPHTIDRAAYHTIFDERGADIAFGYGSGESGWRIDVIDIFSGDLAASLTQDSPLMTRLNTITQYGVVPVIQRYEQGRVDFTIHPAGALNPPYPSFVWDIAENTVNPTAIYANPFNDIFAPTGEVIMAMADNRLPDNADRFLYGQLNALHVYDPATHTRFPFYNSAELWLYRPLFIQNGERILSGGVDASGAFIGWAVVERSGEIAGLVPLADGLLEAAGTGEGFIYLPREDENTVSLWAVNTRETINAGKEIWRTRRTGTPHLIWVGYAAQRVEVPPWRVLALPASAGTTTAPETPSQLSVGGIATIRTIGGDALLVRTEPGRDGGIITRLNSGTPVTLIEGPLVLAGETWWRIRTAGLLEGWVIAEADGIKTLVPD